MVDLLKEYFKKDNSEYMKTFNVIHTACILGMSIMCFLVNIFIEDEKSIYLSLCISMLFILTMFETNRTGNRKLPVIIMSLIFNVIYLPIMFFTYGRYVCVIPIYFIFGIIYTVLLLDIKTGIILSSIEILVYLILLLFGYRHMYTNRFGLSEHELYIRYYGGIVAILVGGLCIGIAIRLRNLYYEKERDKIEKLKLEAMDEYVAKDMFLINMSHEIRTPMNAIVGFVNLLLERDINERVSEYIYNIMNSCNALLAITDEIMDLSKVESGKIEIYETDYDLNEQLLDITNMVTVRLTESNVRFYIDINKEIPRYLHGDISKVRQLFTNLLNNANKFTSNGKIILRVDYRKLDKESIELIVDIEDTGRGIAKEDMDTLFERYQTSSKNPHEKGEEGGIGLAICKELVEAMNGEIAVKTKMGQGSVFTFKLPQKIVSDEPIYKLKSTSDLYALVFESDEERIDYTRNLINELGIRCDAARSKSDFDRLMSVNKYTHVFIANDRYDECEKFLDNRLITSNIVAILDIDDNIQANKASTVINRPVNLLNLTSLFNGENNSFVRNINRKESFTCPYSNILIVDDNFVNLYVASSLIKKYEANVFTASSGRECLRMVKEKDIDLIFLDYMMPEMNGIDTLKNIKKISDPKINSIPIIALTANVVSGAREMLLEAGFDDFIAKPIAIDKMERSIKKFLPQNQIVYKNTQD